MDKVHVILAPEVSGLDRGLFRLGRDKVPDTHGTRPARCEAAHRLASVVNAAEDGRTWHWPTDRRAVTQEPCSMTSPDTPSPPADARRLVAVTAVTLARVPLAGLFALALLAIEPGWWRMGAALAILILFELTDAVDGRLARRWRVTSETGAALDPLCDSLGRLIVFWALAEAALALSAVVLVMALRDVTVAYCRIALASRGRSVAARFSGKAKAIVQGGAAMLLVGLPLYEPVTGAWPIAALSWLVIAVTAWSAGSYITAAMARQGPGSAIAADPVDRGEHIGRQG
jgi:CDP-diacylglycerol---glycerol-3-phosphate 3-phosphatidyltransferase